MKLNQKNFKKLITITCISFVGLFGLFSIYRYINPSIPSTYRPAEFEIEVKGNVKKPGIYTAHLGMTRFEILQIAGLTDTSDIQHIDLLAQITPNESIEVATGEKIMEKEETSYMRVGFSSGQVQIKRGEAISDVDKGAMLAQGDQIITTGDAQVELTFKDGSTIIMDTSSVIEISELFYQESENSLIYTTIKLIKGFLWVKVQPQPSTIQFSFETEHSSIVLRGTEFTVGTNAENTELMMYEGIVQVVPKAGGNISNLIEGQKTKINTSSTGSLLIDYLLDSELDPSENFAAFQVKKQEYQRMRKPYHYLYLVLPANYYLFSLMPSSKINRIISLPPNLLVSDYVQGFDALSDAYLYGGGRMLLSLVENIIKQEISEFVIQDREGLISMIDHMDGLKINLDAQTALKMKIGSGPQKLTGFQVLRYLKISAANPLDFELKKTEVLKSGFQTYLGGKRAYSKSFITEALKYMKSDVTLERFYKHYELFTSVDSWKFVSSQLPVMPTTVEGKNYMKPMESQIQQLFVN